MLDKDEGKIRIESFKYLRIELYGPKKNYEINNRIENALNVFYCHRNAFRCKTEYIIHITYF